MFNSEIFPKTLKNLFLILLAIETPFLLWFMYEWTVLHGFFGGIWFWLKNGAADPIYAAAEIDFLSFIAMVGLGLLWDYKKQMGRVNAIFLFWCVLYLVFPSAGFALYFGFIRPKG